MGNNIIKWICVLILLLIGGNIVYYKLDYITFIGIILISTGIVGINILIHLENFHSQKEGKRQK